MTDHNPQVQDPRGSGPRKGGGDNGGNDFEKTECIIEGCEAMVYPQKYPSHLEKEHSNI